MPRVAVDIGGTFTDAVGIDPATGRLVVGKTLSTPRDLIDGVEDGLAATGLVLRDLMVVHGSTVVINALIERKGARAAIITTEGFRDVYEIGRINRPDAFNLAFEQHRPLVPRERVFEVGERLRADGSVHRALDVTAARALAERLVAEGIEAVAVVFLHSYRNPAHELAMGGILAELCPDVFVTLSHELSREYREFERTSTAAANAFVGPLVSDYLTRLGKRVVASGTAGSVAVMQSNGGLSDVGTAARQAIAMMESGPAGGVVGTIELCRAIGRRDAIAFDMGGTTAKASVIRDLTFPQAAEYYVGGYLRGLPIRIPCLDIVEVGTGGGSTAWVDTAGGLHVGPASAGAEPGPACYGRGGTEATVTDAALVLDVLSPTRALSGGLALDVDAASAAVAALGARVGLGLLEAAGGILAIAAAAMADAVRAVTTERGMDPRDFALFAYGGNGPLHVSLVARELGITTVVIPPEPAVFSALGMLMADLRHDVVLTDIRRLDARTATELDADLTALESASRQVLADGGIDHAEVTFARAADMRYAGQEHTLTVAVPDLATAGTAGLKRAFDAAHLQRYSHCAPAEAVEVVSLRVSAVGALERPRFADIEAGGPEPAGQARLGQRMVTFDAAEPPLPCPVYARAQLRAGNRITGPAAVEEAGTTTLLRPGDSLVVDHAGNLLLSIATLP